MDAIAKVIEDEFAIDQAKSVDKRSALDPDRFGYLSLHYVVALSTTRAGLAEYADLAGLKAEIQIRSILQHSWAEIEHDLGYKTQREIPSSIRRDFSRLAGLLELADAEFMRIRSRISDYTEEVSKQIITTPQNVTLDLVSLRQFVDQESLVAELDEGIAERLGFTLMKDRGPRVDGEVERLAYFQVVTVAQLGEQLHAHAKDILALAGAFASSDEDDADRTLSRGVSLFYLCYILAAKTESHSFIREYLDDFSIAEIRQSNTTIEEQLLEFWRQRNKGS